MSDSTDHNPPREGGPSRDGDADGASEPPPEPSDGVPIHRFTLPALSPRGTRWRERVFAWLDETLSRKTGEADPFYLTTALPVVDRLAGIGSGLIAMVMVDRHYGPAGLGIFAWFFSLLAIAGYLGRYGIPIYLENRIARSPEPNDENCATAMAALYLTYVLLTVIDIGMIAALIAIPILFGVLLWLVGFFNPSYPQSSIEPMQRTPA